MPSAEISQRIRTLQRHPASQSQVVADAAAWVQRPATTRLRVRFQLHGDATQLVWPEPGSASLRLDHLWRATCCEAFIRLAGASRYQEWNFSPAGHWQCYEFSSRREGQSPATVALPAIDLAYDAARGRYTLLAEVEVPAEPLEVGVSLVVADRQGRLEYWALAHGSAVPDFHDPDTWIARV